MRNLFDTRDRDVMPRYAVTGMRFGRVLSPRPGEGGVNSHRSKRWYHFTARPHRTPRIR